MVTCCYGPTAAGISTRRLCTQPVKLKAPPLPALDLSARSSTAGESKNADSLTFSGRQALASLAMVLEEVGQMPAAAASNGIRQLRAQQLGMDAPPLPPPDPGPGSARSAQADARGYMAVELAHMWEEMQARASGPCDVHDMPGMVAEAERCWCAAPWSAALQNTAGACLLRIAMQVWYQFGKVKQAGTCAAPPRAGQFKTAAQEDS
jgi:hypothetical protein